MTIIEKNGQEIKIKLPSGETTFISTQDEWIIKEFPVWGITGSKSKYVFCERSIKTKYSSLRERIYLARLIAKPTQWEIVDHKDRDRLNNRRSNLRICGASYNMANVAPMKNKKVKYKGVCFISDKRNLTKKYVAYISSKSKDGCTKRKNLGYYQTAEEAAKVYDKAAKEIWGEFAYLNFI